MVFLKETLKRLRNRLLVKVMEKQDELSVKAEDLTNAALAKLLEGLSEIRRTVEATVAGKREVAELKTEIKAAETKTTDRLASVANTQAEAAHAALAKLSEGLSEIRRTVEATVAGKREVAELKTELTALKTLLTANEEEPRPISLKTEKGLLNYLKALKGLSKRYAIFIAVKDTTGAFLTDEIADGLRALGFAADLSFEKGLKKQHHHTYVGVIDRGEVVCETMSKGKEASYYAAARDGIAYEAVSKSFPEGNVAVVKIDGVDYATNRRGLNVVVFDPVTRTVIDSVCFDTHVPALTCSRIEEIIEEKVSQLTAINAAGYSVAQYLTDKGVKNVVVYTEARYWKIAELIVAPLVLQKEVRLKGVYAEKPFTRTNPQKVMPTVETRALDKALIDTDCAALIVTPDFFLPPKLTGLKTLQLNNVLTAMANWAFEDRALINFLNHNPGVTMVCFIQPRFPSIKNRSENEQDMVDRFINYSKFRQTLIEGRFIHKSYDGFDFTPSDVLETQTPPKTYYNDKNLRVMEDTHGKMVNCIDGHRVTCFQPKTPKRTIWCVGGCAMFGVGSPDDMTIASQLQKALNQAAPELQIIVQNYAYFYWGVPYERFDALNALPVRFGDIVILWSFQHNKKEYEHPNLHCSDFSALFERPHNYGEVFTDTWTHPTPNGTRAIADALFKFLQEHSFFENRFPPPPYRLYLYLPLRRRPCSVSRKAA